MTFRGSTLIHKGGGLVAFEPPLTLDRLTLDEQQQLAAAMVAMQPVEPAVPGTPVRQPPDQPGPGPQSVSSRDQRPTDTDPQRPRDPALSGATTPQGQRPTGTDPRRTQDQPTGTDPHPPDPRPKTEPEPKGANPGGKPAPFNAPPGFQEKDPEARPDPKPFKR